MADGNVESKAQHKGRRHSQDNNSWSSSPFLHHNKLSISFLIFSKVNPEQLMTPFCMVCRFLLKYKAVVNGSINEIIEDSAPPFLSSHWDGVVRLHLVIFIHTTHVCVVRWNQFETGYFLNGAILLFAVHLRKLLCRGLGVGASCMDCFLVPTLDPSFSTPHHPSSFFWSLLCHRGMQGTLFGPIAKSHNRVFCWDTIPQ